MHPGHCAVIVGNVSITYLQFFADIDRAVGYLRHNLSETETRVGITVVSNYWHWVATMAALRLGLECASVPRSAELNPAIACHFDAWVGDFGPPDSKRIPFSFSDSIQSDSVPEEADKPGNAEGMHFRFSRHAKRIIFTSGTTGLPKIVSLTTEQLEARAHAAIQNLQFEATTRLLPLMGLDTLGGVVMPLAAWLSGGCVMFGIPDAKTGVLSRIPYRQCNLLLVAPARLKEMLDKDASVWAGHSERRMLVGGSRLPKATRDEALKRACKTITLIYGATETSTVAYGDASLLDRHPGAAGYVVEYASLELVDDQDRPVPRGQTGIVRCKSPFMAQKYENGDDLAAFRHGWFYPGDMGVLHEDGLLAINGRVTDVLNLGGYKFSAVELESQLQNVAGVDDICAVVVQEHAGDRLAFALVCQDNADLTSIRKAIADQLPQNIPFHLVRVKALPRNGMGKLPRNVISNKLRALLERVVGKRVLH